MILVGLMRREYREFRGERAGFGVRFIETCLVRRRLGLLVFVAWLLVDG